MDVSTLTKALESISDRDKIEDRARKVGAFQRQSKVRTIDVVLALLRAPCVERKRTIASVRRAWEMLTGCTVAESTFEDRFNPGLLRILCEILRDAMAGCPRKARRKWPPELRLLRDILVCDGIRCMTSIPNPRLGSLRGASRRDWRRQAEPFRCAA